MNINIYQNINPSTMFLGLNILGHNPNLNDYIKVYSGDVRCESIDDVFTMFNLNHPIDYEGRSLSVSDIVQVTSSDVIEVGYYFCDSIGLQMCNFQQ